MTKANAYSITLKRRPRKVVFSGVDFKGLVIEAIEVCQSIQSIDNSVTLIADKSTLVRVYIAQSSVTQKLKLSGELTLRYQENGSAVYLSAINELKLDPMNANSLADKRESLKESFNFRLPSHLIKPGKLYIEVNRLTQLGGEKLAHSGLDKLSVEFVRTPTLRVRCIGLRYLDVKTGKTHSPSAVHFSYFQSYLKRAYPVADIEWSQIVIDANFSTPFGRVTSILANAQVAAIRSSEVEVGMDKRTHYYGLVDDANGKNFMRGRSMGIPIEPQPETVASGPCGLANGKAGDNDSSYADWYSAHELGHTFGRFHPGFPIGDQERSDDKFPYDNGQISSANKKYIGYDFGDEMLGLEMKILSGMQYHDVMTYAERQWVSAYTFEAILQRLIAEENQI